MFEYRELNLSMRVGKTPVEQLNELGSQGWELVSVVARSRVEPKYVDGQLASELVAYLKRPRRKAQEMYFV